MSNLLKKPVYQGRSFLNSPNFGSWKCYLHFWKKNLVNVVKRNEERIYKFCIFIEIVVTGGDFMIVDIEGPSND